MDFSFDSLIFDKTLIFSNILNLNLCLVKILWIFWIITTPYETRDGLVLSLPFKNYLVSCMPLPSAPLHQVTLFHFSSLILSFCLIFFWNNPTEVPEESISDILSDQLLVRRYMEKFVFDFLLAFAKNKNQKFNHHHHHHHIFLSSTCSFFAGMDSPFMVTSFQSQHGSPFQREHLQPQTPTKLFCKGLSRNELVPFHHQEGRVPLQSGSTTSQKFGFSIELSVFVSFFFSKRCWVFFSYSFFTLGLQVPLRWKGIHHQWLHCLWCTPWFWSQGWIPPPQGRHGVPFLLMMMMMMNFFQSQPSGFSISRTFSSTTWSITQVLLSQPFITIQSQSMFVVWILFWVE